jgi:glycosyltransferase involved in cell wall biosynthesis
MKTLLLVTAGLGRARSDEMEKALMVGEYPRISLFNEVMGTDVLDEHFVGMITGPRSRFYRALPVSITQVIEAFLSKRKYDAVISWTEKLGIPFALLLKVTGSRVPHITLFSWISNWKKAVALRLAHSHISRMILMSSVQRDFAVNSIGIPASKIALLKWPVDTKFWRPMDAKVDMVCSVGREMRDYGTLIEAWRTCNVPCHIAAASFPGKKDAWRETIARAGALPPHITIGKKSYTELRDLYARSMFLVMPILPTDTDNGTTSILEAMAMGKPVICSKVRGQADVIEDGKTGFFVPQGDPAALREKMEYLWNNPDIARRMGQDARSFVERNHSLDNFVEQVRIIVSEEISNYNTISRT